MFIVATPNPTTGFLVFVPEAEAKPLAMSVEDALKIVISGGIIATDLRVVPPPGPVRTAAGEGR